MAEAGPGVTAAGATILIIAYEFPPSPSPQSLRWAYLARELAMLGHRVHVLAPEHPGTGHGLPSLPDSVTVHRTFAGPAMGLLNILARDRRRTPVPAAGADTTASPTHPGPSHLPALNWKGRLHVALSRMKWWFLHGIQRSTSACFFPDGRAEWYPWARKRLETLLSTLKPDVVISSHEPATTLSLGLIASRKGFPWVADLGDPVLAPYTPARWRRRALQLEREVGEAAELLTITTAAAAEMLVERHGIPADKLMVLPQGFDGRNIQESYAPRIGNGFVLELLYAGSLYRFRRIEPLIEAVADTPGVRLNIASIKVPTLVQAASKRSASIRILGYIPHSEVIARQRRCDVLVNIANDDPRQVPGKFYEYLGAGRPILHVGEGGDAASDLLLRIGRGWVCRGDAAALRQILEKLVAEARAGQLASSLDLSGQAVREYDWRVIAGRLNERITNMLGV